MAVEIARGTLPPGRLAIPVVSSVRQIAEQIAAQVRLLCGEGFDPASADVDVALPDGRRLSGTVPGVGERVVRAVAFSRVSPSTRLAAWVRLLALTATDPAARVEAVTIGRARLEAERATVTIARIAALAPEPAARRELALKHLQTLADLRDRGLREPLPLACLASAAYARAARDGKNGAHAARMKWQSGFGPTARTSSPSTGSSSAALWRSTRCSPSPRATTRPATGWDERETTRFGRYARRLWDPLLDHEAVSDR